MTNPLENQFDIIGTLTEDYRHIELAHPEAYRMILRKLYGVELDIQVKPLREQRSQAQSKYFWAVIIPHVQMWLREVQGENHKPDEVYAWIRLKLLGQTPRVVTVLGTEVIMIEDKHFSKMNTKEFAETVDLIRERMLQRGLDIPEPTKNNHLHEHWKAKNLKDENG